MENTDPEYYIKAQGDLACDPEIVERMEADLQNMQKAADLYADLNDVLDKEEAILERLSSITGKVDKVMKELDDKQKAHDKEFWEATDPLMKLLRLVEGSDVDKDSADVEMA